jgi:hypothetical protein
MAGSAMFSAMPTISPQKDFIRSARARCASAAYRERSKSMPATTTKSSGINLLIPDDIQDLFGDPPVLRGEDENLYDTLMVQFTKLVEPKDLIEWWWVKDLTDHSWEIRRLRRFKVLFVEVKRDQAHENLQVFALAKVDEDAEYVPVPVPDDEKFSAELLMYLVDKYKSVDKLISSAEVRRSATLREIERRREHLARRLREASDQMIDGKVTALPKAA